MKCDRRDRNTAITVDLDAVEHNLRRCRALARDARVFAVIKADAYGHGAVEILPALASADGIAVVNVAEAVAVRRHWPRGELLVLQGARSRAELADCAALQISVAVHHSAQIDLFDALDADSRHCWLKVDSGMGRLGFSHQSLDAVRARLAASRVQVTGVLTHLACADDRDSAMTDLQIQNFTPCTRDWPVAPVASMANSAALLTRADSLYDWVRPGIMLYGVSPFAGDCGARCGLRPAMRVEAPVIAVREHLAGQSIGYGADYVCERNLRAAVLGIGYGDGYPRSAATGTPVQIGGQLCPLVGRVSMDSIVVDISALDAPVEAGDTAVLWGSDALPVERVAASAGTIPYELLCAIRGDRHWVGGG